MLKVVDATFMLAQKLVQIFRNNLSFSYQKFVTTKIIPI